MKKKEIYWLIGTLGLVLISTFVFLGLAGFKADAALEINIQDTYFVVARSQCIPLIFVFTFFVVYLLRTIKQNFKNSTANLILMITILLAVLLLGNAIGVLDQLSGPPANDASVQYSNPDGKIWGILSKIMLALQIGLLILLAYCGFKTGRNYKAEK